MTLDLIQALLLAFAIVVILFPGYIRLLRHFHFGKQIRVDGPDSHQVKQGTPTMGGLLVILAVIGIYLGMRGSPDASTFAPLAALAAVGLLGAFDDYLNARTGEGIRMRQKLLWQVVFAGFAAWQIQRTYAITALAVPFVGAVPISPPVSLASSSAVCFSTAIMRSFSLTNDLTTNGLTKRIGPSGTSSRRRVRWLIPSRPAIVWNSRMPIRPRKRGRRTIGCSKSRRQGASILVTTPKRVPSGPSST